MQLIITQKKEKRRTCCTLTPSTKSKHEMTDFQIYWVEQMPQKRVAERFCPFEPIFPIHILFCNSPPTFSLAFFERSQTKGRWRWWWYDWALGITRRLLSSKNANEKTSLLLLSLSLFLHCFASCQFSFAAVVDWFPALISRFARLLWRACDLTSNLTCKCPRYLTNRRTVCCGHYFIKTAGTVHIFLILRRY